MRIAFCKTLDIESEVTIDVDDITQALVDALHEAHEKANANYRSQREKQFSVGIFVSNVHQCLRAVTDQMIDTLSKDQRRLIADSLHAQAQRFQPEVNHD